MSWQQMFSSTWPASQASQLAMKTKSVLQVLFPMLSEARRLKIASVVSTRTRSFGVLLENVDVEGRGNENAIARTMDAFGLLCMHRLVTGSTPLHRKRLVSDRTDAGSKQWIEVSEWSNAEKCVRSLKENGYTVVGTNASSPLSILDIDFTKKSIVAFGNEQKGLSKELSEFCDVEFALPMMGFVESFNVSVCVAITLHHAFTQRMMKMVHSKESKSHSMPNRSILKDRKTPSFDVLQTGLPDESLSKLLSSYPQITPTVHAKLTPEEWEQVINFACASLGKSMRMIRKLGEDQSSPENRETNSSSDSLSQKHVTINEEVSTSIYDRGSTVAGMDGTTCVEALNTRERTRQRRRRKDRPNSLPPVYLRSTESPELSKRVESELDSVVPTQIRARANSHEGSYYRRCSSDSVKPKLDAYYPCSSRTRRKKAARGAQRNPNAPVDVSLDDNCPGVAKVRRTHRHTHHHSFCSHYERRPIKDRSYSAEDTRVTSCDQKDDQLPHATLYDMRTASMVFKRSAEITEESVASAFARSALKRTCNKANRTDADSKNLEVIYSTMRDMPVEVGFQHGWNDLVFPKTSRSGRDSPATDMAVISLDLNHPSMLKPLRMRGGNNNNQSTGVSPPQQTFPQETFLHDHNHYHHIIHHTQS